MATFKVVLGKKKADGTMPVKIRIVVRNTNTLVSTPMAVTPKQVTRSGNIKDQAILDACENILREWRATVASLGYEAERLEAKELASVLKRNNLKRETFKLDFIAYMRALAKTKSKSTARMYTTTATSLEKYAGTTSLDISLITPTLLTNYEEWMRGEGLSQGSIVVRMTVMRSTHNAARLHYNDEDAGIVVIPRQPFSRYKVPSPAAAQPRGVDLKTLQAIISLPDYNHLRSSQNLARDVFAISFALGGMNYADIYNLPYSAYKGAYIEYNRAKTKNARADKALYRVSIVDETRALIERYFDPEKVRLFKFHIHHSEDSFKMAVCMGMRRIEHILPYKRHYTFYAARHTYASLARNVVGLDKYTVHELLNHSDKEMRITDRYIERDWQRLFDAHERIVSLIKW